MAGKALVTPSPNVLRSSALRCDGSSSEACRPLAPCSRASRRALVLATAAPNFVSPVAAAIQVKQAEVLVEKLTTGLTAEKLIDKITSVLAGQTTVEPETLMKVITEEPDDAWESLKSNFFDAWTSGIHFISDFDSAAFAQTCGELLAGFAEQFAQWELSSLVALGGRWLIWTPLVVLPMAWRMSNKQEEQAADAERNRQEALELSETARIKQEQVYRELQRLELRSRLLKCLEESRDKVEEVARQLGSLSGGHALQTSNATADGDWKLVYATRPVTSFIPEVPGLDVTDLGQKLLHSIASVQKPEGEFIVQNNATIRFGPLASIQLTVEGIWQHSEGVEGSVFVPQTLKARFLEMLGSSLELPNVSVAVPEQLRQTASWKLLYMDEQLRIHEVNKNELYLFLKPTEG